MDYLKVSIKNCYGINNLDHKFDFTKKNAYILYAPNGTMKTSFTKTFKDISLGKQPIDRITEVSGKYDIKVDDQKIKKEDIFVVESYDEKFGYRNISKLLVNDIMKKNYEELTKEIELKKDEFLKKLELVAGNDIEKELIRFMGSVIQVEKLKELVEKEIEQITGNLDYKYSELFNDKTEKIFINSIFLDAIDEYIKNYDLLIKNSELFSKEGLNHFNLEMIIKSLDSNKFFSINNKIILSNGKTVENIEEFSTVLKEEKDKILNNPEILKKFMKIDSILSKNSECRKLRDILENHKEFILELKNITNFKYKVWKRYFNECKIELENLLALYKSNMEKIKEIIREAEKERTNWENVLEIYKNRFIVPFNLKISNKVNVLLGTEEPEIDFIYSDTIVEESKLKDILSQGERRALYLLQIIYEIEVLKKDNKEKIVIFDDIADSFDYKNKYAIIEYLYELLNEKIFKLVILTHNFDFYRTVVGRLNLGSNKLMAIKRENEIFLEQGQYSKDLFTYWKKNMYKNDRILLSLIPFVRNLIEYCYYNQNQEYNFLTNLLHYKETFSENIKVNDLILVFNKILNLGLKEIEKDNKEKKVLSLIFEENEKILKEENEILLENKIVLSIGCRIKCEKYMLKKIREKNSNYTLPTSNQTRELFNEYKKYYLENSKEKELMEQVNMITPENIHLNSFMYEPLLDMSCEKLKKLYIELNKYQGE